MVHMLPQKGAVTETEFATMSVLKMISNQQVCACNWPREIVKSVVSQQ